MLTMHTQQTMAPVKFAPLEVAPMELTKAEELAMGVLVSASSVVPPEKYHEYRETATNHEAIFASELTKK